LHIGLPVGRYLWVGNHDGLQMKPSIPKIAIDRNKAPSERKSEWAERIKLCYLHSPSVIYLGKYKGQWV